MTAGEGGCAGGRGEGRIRTRQTGTERKLSVGEALAKYPTVPVESGFLSLAARRLRGLISTLHLLHHGPLEVVVHVCSYICMYPQQIDNPDNPKATPLLGEGVSQSPNHDKRNYLH